MSTLDRLTDLVRRSGPRETALFLGLSAAQRMAALRVLQIVAITADRIDAAYLGVDERFAGRFAERDWLLAHAAREPGLGMTPEFVRSAFARGDRCYALTAGDEIASYGWYAHRTTSITDGLELRFDPSYVYMYKGYTRPEYRGRRLHAVGMTRALEQMSAEGYLGLVSFVERTNTASLKSVHRMGYRDVVKYAVMALRRSHRVLRLGGRPSPEVRVQRTHSDTAVCEA